MLTINKVLMEQEQAFLTSLPVPWVLYEGQYLLHADEKHAQKTSASNTTPKYELRTVPEVLKAYNTLCGMCHGAEGFAIFNSKTNAIQVLVTLKDFVQQLTVAHKDLPEKARELYISLINERTDDTWKTLGVPSPQVDAWSEAISTTALHIWLPHIRENLPVNYRGLDGHACIASPINYSDENLSVIETAHGRLDVWYASRHHNYRIITGPLDVLVKSHYPHIDRILPAYTHPNREEVAELLIVLTKDGLPGKDALLTALSLS